MKWEPSCGDGQADFDFRRRLDFVIDLRGFLIAIDADENLLSSEGFPFAWDSGMLTGGGVSINKYAPDGAYLWSVPIHPPVTGNFDHPGYVLGLGTDQAGNVYAAGIYRDTLYLPPDTLVQFPLEAPQYVGDVFLASYDPDGQLRWSRRIGGPRHDVMAVWREHRGAFDVDPEGNTYLGSFYSRGATFGEGHPNELTISEDAFAIVSYDAEGSFRWIRTHDDLGITDNAGPYLLAVDAEGSVFVDWNVEGTGDISTVVVGDTTFTDPDHGGEFIIKVSPDGELLWARQIESDGNEWVNGMATDARGHLYITGNFDGSYLRLENVVFEKSIEQDREDSYVAHYDPDGRLLWAEHIGGDGIERAMSIAASASGDVYVMGEFLEGTMRLGGETYTPEGYDNFFLVKFGAETITSVEGDVGTGTSGLQLENFPNPFSKRTTIRYVIDEPGHVRLSIYDLLGRKVAVLEDGMRQAGTHEITFDGSGLSSGTYIYRLETAGRHAARSIVRVE